jgi:hypothetical protein
MLLLVAGLVLYLAALAATCLYAFVRGGRTERHAAIALLVAAAATQIGGAIGPEWVGPSYWIMAVDAALFVAFAVIARRSERFWPVWIAAAQLCGLITHLAVVVHSNVVTELYLLTQPFWVFPILAGIVWGTRRRHRENMSS